MRVDGHGDLDVRVADDLLNHVRRRAEIQQQRHTGVSEIMKPGGARENVFYADDDR